MNYTPQQFAQAVLKALEELSKDVSRLSSEEKYALAEDPNTPQETLNELSKDVNYFVRCHVAKNPDTPLETLNELAKDVDWRVRFWVAYNPNTQLEVLNELAKDEESWVRTSAENNPSYKPSKNVTLSHEQREALRDLIASSQNENLKNIQL